MPLSDQSDNKPDTLLYTKTQSPAKILAMGVTLLIATALVGCAGMYSSQPPELQVRHLATQRWQALLSKDFEQAYSFAVPSYRQIKTLSDYSSQRQATPVKWIAAEILRVDCVEKKCQVTVKLESKPITPFPFKGNITSGIDETWVLEGQQWWMLETL